MAKKLASRNAQWPLVQEFTFNFNDWAVDTVSRVKKTFGSTVANSVDPLETGLAAGTGTVLDCIPMPLGAYIESVKVFVETAFIGIGTGATLSLGIDGDDDAFVAAADLDAATAGAQLTVESYSPVKCNNGQNIRLTTAGLTATATAGKVRVRVMYTIDNKANENSLT